MGPSKQIKSLKSNGLISFQILPLKKSKCPIVPNQEISGPSCERHQRWLWIPRGKGTEGTDPFIKINLAGQTSVPCLFTCFTGSSRWTFVHKACTLGVLGSNSWPPPPSPCCPDPGLSLFPFLLKADLTHLSRFLKTKPVSAAVCPTPILITFSFPTDLGDKTDKAPESSGMYGNVSGPVPG